MTQEEWFIQENELFKRINKQVHSLDEKQFEELNDFLGNMEELFACNYTTLKEYESYIKRFKRKNKILIITFKTRDKRKLAHICKYILDLEWNNEWARAVAGIGTKTIFGWFD